MRRALLLAALLGLAGCAHLPWIERAVPVPVEQASEALATLREGALARHSLRAKGRLEVDAPAGGTGRVDEVVLAQRPDLLRLETLSPLGQALSFLVTDGARYAYFDGERLESGELDARTLHERMGLALDPREAVDVLLAAPSSAGEPAQSAFRRGEELWVVQDGFRLGFAPDGELAALEALDERGKLRWRARYAGWCDVPGGRYPLAVSLEFPGTRVEARLELSRVELNAALGPERFRLPGARE
jgi:hypothetical protein